MGARGRTWAGMMAVAIALLLVLAPGAAAKLRGALDPSFGDGGKVVLGFGPTYAKSNYWSVARQPDGSLVLAGHTESIQGNYIEGAELIQRRLPNGALDPSFHQVVDDEGSYGPVGLALENDGDILYTGGGEYTGTVKRLEPDGTPDTSYGKAGAATVPFSPKFLAIDAQGRTVVAGTAGVGGDCHDCQPTPVVAVARLMPNGAFDPTFGDGGTLIMSNIEAGYGGAVGLALQADGSIVVAGGERIYGLTANGALDPAFGHEGSALVEGDIAEMAQTTAGDLVVTGASGYSCCSGNAPFVLHAFLPDGSPDSAWGTAGTQTIPVADIDVPTALAPGPEGTLMLAGETAFADQPKGCQACNFQPYVARLGANGAVDPGFSARLVEPATPYREVGPSGGYSSRVGAMVVLPGGGVVLAGGGSGGAEYGEQATATALSPSGAPEAAFGTAGVAADRELLPSDTQATAFAAGPGGSLVASYFSDTANYREASGLAAWNADGEPVPGYVGEADLGYATANGADGRGRLYRVEQRSDAVRRLGVDGRTDPSYGSAGSAPLPHGFDVKALVVRRSGAALLVGHIAGRDPMALYELTPSGRPDRHFGEDGLVMLGWGKGKKATALSATFDGRGRIVLFGLYGRQTPLARLLPDGRPDPSFGADGRINFRPELATEDSELTVAKDGRIYLATSPDDGGETTLVRFLPDGVRDRSFGTGGVVRLERVPSLVRLFVGGRRLVLVSGDGYFKRTGFALRAFGLDGSLESSFADGGVYEGGTGVTKGLGVIGAVREPDGDIVVAGTLRPKSYGERLELLRFR